MASAGSRSVGAQALKEAGLAAIVAFALALPLVGFETADEGGSVVVRTRFDWVAIGVAAVFVGRLVLALWPAEWKLHQKRERRHVAKDTSGRARLFAAIGL